MANHILNKTVEIRRLSAAEAEVWVAVELGEVTPATELRGRLTGPRCHGVTTVEVAYPLRPLPVAQGPTNVLTLRVLIPEPNLWTKETPFYYAGRLELWHQGRRADVATWTMGLMQPR